MACQLNEMNLVLLLQMKGLIPFESALQKFRIINGSRVDADAFFRSEGRFKQPYFLPGQTGELIR